MEELRSWIRVVARLLRWERGKSAVATPAAVLIPEFHRNLRVMSRYPPTSEAVDRAPRPRNGRGEGGGKCTLWAPWAGEGAVGSKPEENEAEMYTDSVVGVTAYMSTVGDSNTSPAEAVHWTVHSTPQKQGSDTAPS